MNPLPTNTGPPGAVAPQGALDNENPTCDTGAILSHV